MTSRSRSSTSANASLWNRGFTLIELLVAITIMAGATAWALPRLNHKIQQGKVDTYTQNIETGLFSLMARVRRSSKYCTLFESNPAHNQYADPNSTLELGKINTSFHDQLINCPCSSTSKNCSTPFRFLHRENTKEAELVQVLISRKKYGLSPQGTNPEGEELIMRIRSKDWNQNQQVLTRCIVISGNGHLFKGTWNYQMNQSSPTACKRFCSVGGNCNG